MITLQVHEAAKSKQNLYLYFIICTLALEIAAGDSFFNRSCLEPVPSTSPEYVGVGDAAPRSYIPRGYNSNIVWA